MSASLRTPVATMVASGCRRCNILFSGSSKSFITKSNRTYLGLGLSTGLAVGVNFEKNSTASQMSRCEGMPTSTAESVLMIFVTKDRSGLLEDASQLLKSQDVELTVSNVSKTPGQGTRLIYHVQDTVTGESLSAERLALAKRALMSLQEVTFVHVVPQ